jgi:transcriptional regulator with XRE-family HTH domain
VTADEPGFTAKGITFKRAVKEIAASDTVAANIRDVRKRLGWTVADLAEHCHPVGGGAEALSLNVIENIEHGRKRNGKRTRFITVDELLAIARALSVPPSALMPELGEGPLDVPVLFGLDDAESALRVTLERIADVRARLEARRGEDEDE